eukprot:3094792-Pyramimonas_sp.AAC.1
MAVKKPEEPGRVSESTAARTAGLARASRSRRLASSSASESAFCGFRAAAASSNNRRAVCAGSAPSSEATAR